MLPFLKRLFSGKKTKFGQRTSIDKLKTGQAIEVRFYDPKSLGFLNAKELTYTRFNADELEDGNRTIQGIVEQVLWQHDIGWILKVATFQIRSNKPTFRSYLFLESEIEYARILS